MFLGAQGAQYVENEVSTHMRRFFSEIKPATHTNTPVFKT